MDKPKTTPGPWTACNFGKCKCGQIWGNKKDKYHNEYPVATVERGEWGDDYYRVKIGDDGQPEVYNDFIAYGMGASEEEAAANAMLIINAPGMYDLLYEIYYNIKKDVTYAMSNTLMIYRIKEILLNIDTVMLERNVLDNNISEYEGMSPSIGIRYFENEEYDWVVAGFNTLKITGKTKQEAIDNWNKAVVNTLEMKKKNKGE